MTSLSMQAIGSSTNGGPGSAALSSPASSSPSRPKFDTAVLQSYLQKLLSSLLTGKTWEQDKDRMRGLVQELGARVKERALAIQPTGFKYIVTVSRASQPSLHSLTRHTTTDVHDDIPEAESSSDEPLDVSLIELYSQFASSRSVNENLGQGGRAGLSSHWEESDQSLTEVWSNDSLVCVISAFAVRCY